VVNRNQNREKKEQKKKEKVSKWQNDYLDAAQKNTPLEASVPTKQSTSEATESNDERAKRELENEQKKRLRKEEVEKRLQRERDNKMQKKKEEKKKRRAEIRKQFNIKKARHDATIVLQKYIRGAIVREYLAQTRAYKRKVIKCQARIRKYLTRQRYLKYYKAHRVAAEILSTEETYLARLHTIVKVYLEPLQVDNKEFKITKDEVKIIFNGSLIDIISNFHETIFLPKLREKLKYWTVRSTLGDAFAELIGFMKIYSQYINGFDASIVTLKKLRTKPKFNLFLEQRLSQSYHLELEALLIEPIQRVPRYELLLKELLTCTPADHPDYHSLTAAFSEVKNIAATINRRKKDSDVKLAVVNIYNSVTPPIKDLISPTRRLLHEGDVTFVKKKKEYHLFLFNDLILKTRPRKRTSGNKYKLKAQFQINAQVTIDGNEGVNGFQHCFTIRLRDSKSIIWSVKTKQEKNEWIQAIKDAVGEIKNSEIERERVRVIMQKSASSVNVYNRSLPASPRKETSNSYRPRMHQKSLSEGSKLQKTENYQDLRSVVLSSMTEQELLEYENKFRNRAGSTGQKTRTPIGPKTLKKKKGEEVSAADFVSQEVVTRTGHKKHAHKENPPH